MEEAQKQNVQNFSKYEKGNTQQAQAFRFFYKKCKHKQMKKMQDEETFDCFQINHILKKNKGKLLIKTKKYPQNQLPVLRNAFDTSFVVDSLEWDFKVHTHSIDKIIIFLQPLA